MLRMSVPATQNALAKPIATGGNPTYTPTARTSPGKLKPPSFLTPSQAQIHLGATEPKLAVLPVNAGVRKPPVNETGPVSGVSEIRPLSLKIKGGTGPGSPAPGQYGTQAGQAPTAPGARSGGRIAGSQKI